MVNLKGGYLMPGLINMHVHLAGSGKPQKKQRDNEKLVKTILSTGLTRKVAYGMVAGLGGLADFDTRLRDDIRAGRRVGPRILAANEGISVPGGHMAGLWQWRPIPSTRHWSSWRRGGSRAWIW